MYGWQTYYAPLIGRIFVGAYFLWTGLLEVLNFQSTVVAFSSTWIPDPNIAALISVILQLLGGVMLILGMRVRMVALILALYMIAAAFLYTNFGNGAETASFIKDLAIIGGLMYISAYGTNNRGMNWRRV